MSCPESYTRIGRIREYSPALWFPKFFGICSRFRLWVIYQLLPIKSKYVVEKLQSYSRADCEKPVVSRQTSTEVNILNWVTQIGFITHSTCVICQRSYLNPMKPALFILRWLTLACSYTLHSQFCFRRVLNQKCCKDSRNVNTHTHKCRCVTCHITPRYPGDISGSKRFIDQSLF